MECLSLFAVLDAEGFHLTWVSKVSKKEHLSDYVQTSIPGDCANACALHADVNANVNALSLHADVSANVNALSLHADVSALSLHADVNAYVNALSLHADVSVNVNALSLHADVSAYINACCCFLRSCHKVFEQTAVGMP